VPWKSGASLRIAINKEKGYNGGKAVNIEEK
jgi:hypothetical protein